MCIRDRNWGLHVGIWCRIMIMVLHWKVMASRCCRSRQVAVLTIGSLPQSFARLALSLPPHSPLTLLPFSLSPSPSRQPGLQAMSCNVCRVFVWGPSNFFRFNFRTGAPPFFTLPVRASASSEESLGGTAEPSVPGDFPRYARLCTSGGPA